MGFKAKRAWYLCDWFGVKYYSRYEGVYPLGFKDGVSAGGLTGVTSEVERAGFKGLALWGFRYRSGLEA